MDTAPLYCTRCGERLNPTRVVWLELNGRSGAYAREGVVPPEQSQGGFPFGSACAKSTIANGGHV